MDAPVLIIQFFPITESVLIMHPCKTTLPSPILDPILEYDLGCIKVGKLKFFFLRIL